MTAPLSLTLEPAKLISLQGETGLLDAALARNPGNTPLREKIAYQYIERDRFEEAIGLLSQVDPAELSAKGLLSLAKSYYSRRSHEDDELARAAARQALAKAKTPQAEAQALADMAKADVRAGRMAEVAEQLERALALDPHSTAAFRRLTLAWLRGGAPARALALAESQWAAGVRHARVLTVRILALAMLGRIGEARALSDTEHHVRHAKPAAPEPWADLMSFNRQLAEELQANPDRRYEAHGVASRRTTRIDTPRIGETPAISALLAMLTAEVRSFAAELAAAGSDWALAKPGAAVLQCWAVHPDADGYEQWHLHPNGWMSGGYYVAVPDAVSSGEDTAGCIGFGLPEGIVGDGLSATFGEKLVRPLAGSLLLFPSHSYHRTYPHGACGDRICFAFDIVPERQGY